MIPSLKDLIQDYGKVMSEEDIAIAHSKLEKAYGKVKES